MVAPLLRGSLDRCEPDCISGWAQLPTGNARLTVFCGDRLIGACIADLHRPDLPAATGDRRFGFRFAPNPKLSDNQLRSLTIEVAGADHVFLHGARAPVPRGHVARLLYRLAPPPTRKRFARCVLHIGTEKTGTTTLQTWLWRNRAALAHDGYHLPLALAPDAGVMNHIHLATLAMDDAILRGDLREAAHITTADALWSFRAKTFASLARELEQVSNDVQTLLLSSEHCHSRLGDPAALRHLKTFLDPFCETFEILVYLRPQHELAISRHGMAIMLGFTDDALFPQVIPAGPRPAHAEADRIYFDYDRLLTRWADVFGASAIRPRLFQRASLAGGTLIDDFAAALNVDPAGYFSMANLGGNISAAAQRFLLGLYDTPAGRMLPIETRLWLSERLRQIAPGGGIPPTRAAAQAFAAQFAATNEAVRTRWFPTRKTLFEADFTAFPIRPDEAEIPPDTIRGFVDLIAQARFR